MVGAVYIGIPAILVGLAVPITAITCWRIGQHLAGVICERVMEAAMTADGAISE